MKLKCLFFGTPDFALPSLRALTQCAEVVGVVCQADKPRGRGQKLSPCPVKILAQELRLPVFSPESLKTSEQKDLWPEKRNFDDFLKSTRPDINVVVAYGKILGQHYLELPKHGSVNVHASLLPRWRGAAPMQRALESGDTITGVTIQKMVQELDAGDVLLEQKHELSGTETAIELSAALSEMGADLLKNLVDVLVRTSDLPQARPQQPELVTLARKITKSEAMLTHSTPAATAFNKFRAFAAWPELRVPLVNEDSLIVKSCSLVPSDGTLQPGFNVSGQKCVFVSSVRPSETYNLFINTVRAPGRNVVSGYDFFSQMPKELLEAIRRQGFDVNFA